MLRIKLLFVLFFAFFTILLEAAPFNEQEVANDWCNERKPPVIQSFEDNSFVFLSNGAVLKLRPVLYFAEQHDLAPIFYVARKEFTCMEELFSSKGLKETQVFAFNEGQNCQILLPPKNEVTKFYNVFPPAAFFAKHEFRKYHGYWCWVNPKSPCNYYLCGNYKTIPLNFHDTSVNLGPLRATLNEYPMKSYFFSYIYCPYSADEFTVASEYAHLIEADLLEFHDHVQNRDGDLLKLESSHINAKLISNEALRDWENGDRVVVTYEEVGIYRINNLTKTCAPIQVYLSDDRYSDLRNYPIFEDSRD